MLDGPHGPHVEKLMPTTDSKPTPSRVNPARSNFDIARYFMRQIRGRRRERESWYFRVCSWLKLGLKLLVLQRNHGLVVLTEGRDTLQAALGLGYVHHRTVAVHRMAIGSEVPLPTLPRMPGGSLDGRVGRWREPRDG
jgi:hypothetical protein